MGDTPNTAGHEALTTRPEPPCGLQNRYALGKSLAVMFCEAANGKVFGVTIDVEDLPRVLAAGRWRVANFHGFCGRFDLYCYTVQKRKNIYLHRFITSPPRRLVVDHAHHRTLDNRKSELKVCTQGENLKNRRAYLRGPNKDAAKMGT